MKQSDRIRKRLKELPASPGVYFHKDRSGKIIYVGKASILKNRVRQYFQSSRDMDPKTLALVAEITDFDWITVDSEMDALFLESEMIKRYKPRFNILMRDDKSELFVRINMNDPYPYVSYTHRPLDDGANYYGPYYNGGAAKRALRSLRRVFPYSTHQVMPKRLCLQYHLGLCPGVEAQMISSQDYKKTLRSLIDVLQGGRKRIIGQLEKEMRAAAKEKQFETAAMLRNKIFGLKALSTQIVFGDEEFMDISKDHALKGLSELLGLKNAPRRIEGYDISHMQGTHNVASMVVATNGIADKTQYRKFKMRLPGNNDFGHMHEVITRRFNKTHDNWPKPDLLVIDGGRGQLAAALDAMDEREIKIPAVGLAKRLEEVVIHKSRSNVDLHLNGFPTASVRESDDFVIVLLDHDSDIVKLLQRVRDESHRFAVSYHTNLKRDYQTKSILDEIPGIGPATRRKLVQAFGSAKAIETLTQPQLAAVIGGSKAKLVFDWAQKR
ncbi:MAG TPA: excinuclease ABC subunit UvrC [Candidatus Saccharimonadales bacterium]|nr:excinuclease ABC subunit UvrC [Candidatus Saccharimonadales bacterium]